MIESVAIVGCGWFGLPLAQSLAEQNIAVFGSKRLVGDAALLSENNIIGFKLDLDNEQHLVDDRESLTKILDVDCLVVNIPPGLRKDPQAYLQRLSKLLELIACHTYKKLIFVSTTGVYPAIDAELTEQDAKSHSLISEKLLQAEQMFASKPNSCIVRFAGLVGPKRHPGRFLAGKTGLSGANSAVNLVHLNDCIAAVTSLIFNKTPSAIYNVCAPIHPKRRDFYYAAALDLGLVPPQFNLEQEITDCSGSAVGKLINSDRLMNELNFEFQFDDPVAMLAAC